MNKTKPIPAPRNHLIFDPWNTGCAGHERAQHSHATRTAKYHSVRAQQLGLQFRGVHSEGVLDGLEKQKEKEKEAERARKRKRGEGDIRGYMGGLSKKTVSCSASAKMDIVVPTPEPGLQAEQTENLPPTTTTSSSSSTPDTESSSPKIFASLIFYINGSTFPLISDYKLRHLIAEYGGSIAMNHARRSVTHVIIANPASSSSSGARCAGGGGLSGAKLQKEIATTAGKRGKGVKFVGVEWCVQNSIFN